MTRLSFSLELAQQYFESTEQFSVDFDNAWVWLGYARKDSGLRALKSNFVHGEDYISSYGSDLSIFHTSVESNKDKTSSINGRLPEKILLTCNCVKEMGMMAGTEQGKQVRKYFLECERIAKTRSQQNKGLSVKTTEDRVAQQMQNAKDFKMLFGLNPTAEQLFKDSILNMMVDSNQNQLSGFKEDWRGIVSFAEELGFKVPINGDKCRTKLGKFVAINAPELAKYKEIRLCNEVQRHIYVYPLHIPEVRNKLTDIVNCFFEVTQSPVMRLVEQYG